MKYAGFWLRFVACIIDFIVIYIAQAFIFVPVLGILGLNFASKAASADDMSDGDMMGMIAATVATVGALGALIFVLQVLYFSFMEASKYQGTLGKMALGLIVTDTNGGKLDFAKALIRNLCKIISSVILYIGYIMAGFTEKKQALHDIIASTLVVKKS